MSDGSDPKRRVTVENQREGDWNIGCMPRLLAWSQRCRRSRLPPIFVGME